MHHLHPCILNTVAVPYSFDEAVNSIKYDLVLWLLYLRNGTFHSDLTNFVCQQCCIFIMSLMSTFLLPRENSRFRSSGFVPCGDKYTLKENSVNLTSYDSEILTFWQLEESSSKTTILLFTGRKLHQLHRHISGTSSKKPPRASVHQLLCRLTPCLLVHQHRRGP